MLTKAKLERFVKIRRKSGFSSNLQFGIDAQAAGFSVDDLPKPLKFELDGFHGYQWDIPVAEVGQSLRTNLREVRMIELNRFIGLDFEPKSVQMFEAVKKRGKLIEEAA